MHLQAEITVGQTNEHVWEFFGDPYNLIKWDRSVAQVILTSPDPFGVGSTFDTVAPVRKSCTPREGLRMTYRVTEYVPNQRVTLLLTDSPMFQHAEWRIMTQPSEDGVRILCQLDCKMRRLYGILMPVLLLTYKDAFRRDLTYLKQAIEAN